MCLSMRDKMETYVSLCATLTIEAGHMRSPFQRLTLQNAQHHLKFQEWEFKGREECFLFNVPMKFWTAQ